MLHFHAQFFLSAYSLLCLSTPPIHVMNETMPGREEWAAGSTSCHASCRRSIPHSQELPRFFVDPRLLPAELPTNPVFPISGDAPHMDVMFFGVPWCMTPAIFAERLIAAGLPGFTMGKICMGRKVVRVRVSDHRMITLISTYGIAIFSKIIRHAYRWRCVLATVVASETTRVAVPLTTPSGLTVARPVPSLEAVHSDINRVGLRIGSWNVCGGVTSRGGRAMIELPLKLQEILDYVSNNSFDIVAIQESLEGPTSFVSGNAMYTWFPDVRHGMLNRGLGFFVRNVTGQRIITVGLADSKCTHCQWLCLKGTPGVPDLYIGNVYLPTDGTSVAIVDRILEDLQTDVLHLAERGEVIMLGDFNSRVGRASVHMDRIGIYGEDSRNSRGTKLLRFLEAIDMYAVNGRKHCADPEWTRVVSYRSGMQSSSILDYAIVGADLIGRNWNGENFQVHQTNIAHADHKLIHIDLDSWGISRSSSFRIRKTPFYRWNLDSILMGEQKFEVRQAYAEALNEELPGFQAIVHSNVHAPGRTVEDAANFISTAWERIVTRVASRHVGRKLIIPDLAKPWWDREMREAIDARRRTYAQWMVCKAPHLWDLYIIHRKKCKMLASRKKQEHRDKRVSALGKLYKNNTRMFWRCLNTELGKKAAAGKHRISMVKKSDGTEVSDDTGIMEAFRDHYSTLGTPNDSETSSAISWKREVEEEVSQYAVLRSTCSLGNPFTENEISDCLRKLKNGKASHTDNIPNELMKYGGDSMVQLLLVMFNALLHIEKMPGGWREGLITSLFKEGDRVCLDNYRGITMLSTVGKLFCACIKNRIQSKVSLHDGQAGFRPERSCIDNIFVLSEALHSRIGATPSLTTFAFFLDVRKAFDTVWHDGLWYKLWHKGVQGKIWRLLRNMYLNMGSRVLVNGEVSHTFPIRQGTAQGCTLSPLLFNIFIDGLMRAVDEAGFGTEVLLQVGSLMYADDYVGLETSPQRLQALIDVIREYLQQWGLRANIVKSAVVVFGRNTSDYADFIWKWGDEEIPIKHAYKYLGVMFHSSGKWNVHVDTVISKGHVALARYNNYFTSRKLTIDVKLLIYKQYVRPSLEYASEIWTCSETQAGALERIQLSAARKILGCFRNTASVGVLVELGLQKLAVRRLASQVRWYNKMHSTTTLSHRIFQQTNNTSKWLAQLQRKWQQTVGGPIAPQLGKVLINNAALRAQHVEMDARSTMSLLKLINPVPFKLQPYLKGKTSNDKGTKLKMKFRTGTIEVGDLMHRRRVHSSSHGLCIHCGRRETVEHVIMACEKYDHLRFTFFSKLKDCFSSYAVFREFLQDTSTDFELVSHLLNDRFWMKKGAFQAANALICDFLLKIWELRA